MIWQATWGHLRELHAAVKQSSVPLLFGTHSNFSLGQEQEVQLHKGNFMIYFNRLHQDKDIMYDVLQAHIFETESQCVAFLVNFDRHHISEVIFRNISLQLAPKSISILSKCKSVVFETAKVGKPTLCLCKILLFVSNHRIEEDVIIVLLAGNWSAWIKNN